MYHPRWWWNHIMSSMAMSCLCCRLDEGFRHWDLSAKCCENGDAYGKLSSNHMVIDGDRMVIEWSELETGSLVPNFYHGSAVWLKGPKAKCQRGHVITWLYKIYIRQVKLTLNLFFKDHMMLVKKVGSKASSVHGKCTPSKRGWWGPGACSWSEHPRP